MAEWVKQIIEEVDKQFDDLPEWKRAAAEQFLKSSENTETQSCSIREPRIRQDSSDQR